MSSIKIARNIEATVIAKFLDIMNSHKDELSSVEDIYKKMESMKKTHIITDDEIVECSKKKKTVTGRPKNSWMLFLQKYREDNPGNGKSGKEISQEASTKWNNMSDEEKLPYTKEAEKLMNDWKLKIQKDKSDDDDKQVQTPKQLVEKSSSKKDDKSTEISDKEPQTELLSGYVKYLKSATNHQWCYVDSSDDDTFRINIKSGKEGGKQQLQEKTFDSKDELDKYIHKETSSREKKGYVKCC